MVASALLLRIDGRCQSGKPGPVLSFPAYNIVPPSDRYGSGIKYRNQWCYRYCFVWRDRIASLGHRRGAHIVGYDSRSSNYQEGSQRVRFKYLAEVSYDGTDYNGFQLQPKCPTIQGSIERALKNYCGLSREELIVQGAARTDSGVHARQQFVEFYSSRQLQQEDFVRSLNRMLPASIAVHSLRHVEESFNVRYSQGKIYTYDIHLSSIRDPFACRYRHVPRHPGDLNIDAIKMACPLFVGTKDFRLLTNATRDDCQTPEHDTTRHMYQVDVERMKDGLRIAVMGKGFMYKQVRNMAGVLLAVGVDKITLDDVEILLQGDVTRAGTLKSKYKVAEAKGLTLQRVFLQDEPVPNEHCVFELLKNER